MYNYICRHMRFAPDIETLQALFELAKKQGFSREIFMKINTLKNHRKEELLLPF